MVSYIEVWHEQRLLCIKLIFAACDWAQPFEHKSKNIIQDRVQFQWQYTLSVTVEFIKRSVRSESTAAWFISREKGLSVLPVVANKKATSATRVLQATGWIQPTAYHTAIEQHRGRQVLINVSLTGITLCRHYSIVPLALVPWKHNSFS